MAPALSKFAPLPFNCYEIGHTWTPSCSKACWDVGTSTFKEGFKIYTTCYVLSLLVSGRYPKAREDVLKVLKDILRSSAFLSVNGFGFMFFLCTIRRLKGSFNFFTLGFVPTILAAYCAILIEKPQRRPLLALYVANVASETIYRMLRARGILSDVKHFDLVLYCLSIVTIICQMKSGVSRADITNTVFRKIYGDEEFKSQGGEMNTIVAQRRSNNANFHGARRMSLGGPGLRVLPAPNQNESDQNQRRLFRDDTYRNRFIHFVLWMHRSVEEIASHLERMVIAVYEGQAHEMCPHNETCFDYWMMGFCSRFLTGFGIQSILQAFMLLKKLLGHKVASNLVQGGSILNSSVLFPCVKTGTGFGVMCLAFRLICCSFRWLKGMDGPGHAGVAGLLSTVLGFFLLRPPPSLAVYLFFKAAESVISESHRVNNWRLFRILDKIYGGGWSLLYAFSTALLFHTGIVEPQNLKPSYYQFLARVTGRKIYDINREIISVYGTNSDILVKDFLPNLNPKFLSDTMKKFLQLKDQLVNKNIPSKQLVYQLLLGM